MIVINCFCGSGITSATIPPVAAATIGATMGRSHAAVIVLSFAWCLDMLEIDPPLVKTSKPWRRIAYMIKGSPRQVAADIAASIHHSPQATFHQDPPQLGTQTNAVMLIMVARPIGNVPRNKLCAGCRSIAIHILGHIV